MQRTIKSYVVRAGRMSNRQCLGYEQYLNDYLLPLDGKHWDLETIFPCQDQVIVEIGFGMGGSLLAMAKQRPDHGFIGIDVHRAGIGRLAADIHDEKIDNVRIAPYDALEVFRQQIPPGSLAGIQIFFPDPWPKKRHHKRRLIQTDIVQLLVEALKPNGFLHCATDWEDYAEQMLTVLSAEPQLYNQQEDGGYSPRPDSRPITKFEQRGNQLGHSVRDLIFRRRE